MHDNFTKITLLKMLFKKAFKTNLSSYYLFEKILTVKSCPFLFPGNFRVKSSSLGSGIWIHFFRFLSRGQGRKGLSKPADIIMLSVHVAEFKYFDGNVLYL